MSIVSLNLIRLSVASEKKEKKREKKRKHFIDCMWSARITVKLCIRNM